MLESRVAVAAAKSMWRGGSEIAGDSGSRRQRGGLRYCGGGSGSGLASVKRGSQATGG
jgi:hypothetical protein